MSRPMIETLPAEPIIRQPILAPSVRALMSQFEALPPCSALLGVCEDGLPLLLRLSEAESAPLLVTGDAGCGKTRLLQALVDSLIQANSPDYLQFTVLASEPREWIDLADLARLSGHCRGLAPAGSAWGERLLLETARLVEQRLDGDPGGPGLVLALDDFTPLLETGYSTQVQLRWLLENGPQARVWVVAALQAEQARGLPYWVDPFRARILGKIESPQTAAELAIAPDCCAPALNADSQFCAWTGDAWVSFWLPGAAD